MGRIDLDLRNHEFEHFYLIYGNEEFRKQTYKNKLISALVSPDDTMNLTVFSGKDTDVNEVAALCETLPFFAEARVVCIEGSGWFKGKADFAERAGNFPESTYVIFVESDVSEKSPLFKFVKDKGVCEEIRTLNDQELVSAVQAILRAKGQNISRADAEYFVTLTGTDMANVQSEIYKLRAYCAGNTEITKADIDVSCHPVLETKVYNLVDKIIEGKRDEALTLYAAMCEEKEDVSVVLRNIIISYNQLYLTAKLSEEGSNEAEIIKEVGMRDFVARKYLRIIKKKSTEKIKSSLSFALSLDRKCKSGLLNFPMAVEIFIVKNTSV
ncbi:MAG: DNA polymerase III subunit delta [Lachnospiraceae bacterium]|nr:DNA polymerase III subunit delta [Lachnospiraceae bacterium]